MKHTLVLSAFAAITSIGGAQSINIDFEDPAGVAAGVPSNTFGAAGNAGAWNAATLGLNGPLFDINGVFGSASVDITATAVLSNNAQNYAGDDLLLMGDIADGPSLVTFAGLANGPYDVWVYAQAPDSATFLTDVTIGGVTQTVGGAWGGTYVVGNTHSFHNGVNVTDGTLTITMATNTGFASLNGIQIAVVPEPATIAAFGIGALTLLALRRRR